MQTQLGNLMAQAEQVLKVFRCNRIGLFEAILKIRLKMTLTLTDFSFFFIMKINKKYLPMIMPIDRLGLRSSVCSDF